MRLTKQQRKSIKKQRKLRQKRSVNAQYIEEERKKRKEEWA